MLGAIGVLIGGWIAARTERHALVAATSMLMTALACILMATVDLGAVLLILVMSLSGLMTGALMPSRDMIVREVTPPGAFGKVFGFVTNGFNIAGMVSPLIFGALMDHGEPRAVFLALAVTPPRHRRGGERAAPHARPDGTWPRPRSLRHALLLLWLARQRAAADHPGGAAGHSADPLDLQLSETQVGILSGTADGAVRRRGDRRLADDRAASARSAR